MSVTVLQAAVTKTAAFSGAGVDVSAIDFGATIKVRVTALTEGKSARIAIEESLDAFNADTRTVTVLHFIGGIGAPAEVVQAVHTRTLPDCDLGGASATWRARLQDIDAASSITYEAFLEH